MTGAPFTFEHYRCMIGVGRDAGYRYATFDELPRVRAANERACFLRHDCDNDPIAAAALARIEAELGVRTTYFFMTRAALYNVMAPKVATLVHEIVALGHRLALHFDELPYRGLPSERIAAQVDRERSWLAEEFGQQIDVVSFHQPSARVLSNDVRLNCLNTYDKKDMAGLHYISDSNFQFRTETPVECFRRGEHRQIQLALHPECWTEQAMEPDRKWDLALVHSVELMQDSMLAREDTFKRRRTVSIGEASNGHDG
jgi:peptidoglycan/xylan/chitin deacetylase (PgdA/CDA1 family)